MPCNKLKFVKGITLILSSPIFPLIPPRKTKEKRRQDQAYFYVKSEWHQTPTSCFKGNVIQTNNNNHYLLFPVFSYAILQWRRFAQHSIP